MGGAAKKRMGVMKRVCPKCGKVVDLHHSHPRPKYKRKWNNDDPERKIRNSFAWQKKREEIKKRDGGIDQIAANGLDGSPYIETRRLQVHHIIPLEERPDLAFDNSNLITVSPRTHELAETNAISREALLALVKILNQK